MKKLSKIKSTVIKVPIWDLSIHVYITNDFEDTISRLNEELSFNINAELFDYNSSGICYFNNKTNYILILLKSTDQFIALHECVHAVFSIKEVIGWLDNDEEVFAYTLEYIYKQLMTFLQK